MSNQENNKMIAEFMGNSKEYEIDINTKTLKSYHTSWDWLMPVVNKIEDYLSDKFGEVGYFDECLSSNDLEVRYQAVVEFINQYNKNK